MRFMSENNIAKILCVFVLFYHGLFASQKNEEIQKMACFDYCGVEIALKNGHPLGKGTWFEKGNSNDVSTFASEPIRGLSVEEMNQIAFLDYKWLYINLVTAEAVGVSGNKRKFNRYSEAFCSLIQTYEKHSDVFGTFTIRRFRPKVEYMLARIVNDRRPATIKLSPSDIRRILPPISQKGMVWDESLWHCWRTRETFRRMLILGAALEEHLRKFGALPKTLKVLDGITLNEMKDAYDNEISYSHLQKEWMLYSKGNDTRKNEILWDVYVPCNNVTGGYTTPEVCFASSFSRKRESLYRLGVLNEKHPSYRCYMRGDVIYRGGSKGTPHIIKKEL